MAISLGTTFVAAAAAAVRQAVALELALGATSTKAALASLSIKGMAAALRTLRGAIISTGIGIVVVGAGELIYQFGRLVSATGGFGTALGLVKDVAVEVWERIGNGADFVYQSIKTMIYNAKAVFVGGLNAMVGAWIDLTWTVADGLNSLFGTNLQGASAEITQSLAAIQTAAEDAAGAAKADAEAAAKAFSAPLESVQALRDAVAKTQETTEDGASAADRLNTSLQGVGDGAGAASKGLKDAAKSVKSFDQVLKDAVKTAAEMEEEGARSVVSGIGSISDAFGDFLLDGARDFDGFMDSILGGFKSMISEMISTAARNKILINMGTAGTPGVSGTLSTSGGVAGGGGAFGGGGFLGSALGIGSSFLSGASGLVTSLFGAGGGLGSAATYLSAVVGGATASLGAFAAAIGAIAGPLALAIPLITGLFGKTKLLDAGLRVTIDGMDGLVETFKYVKKTALFGLISSKKYSYSPADAEVADPVLLAVQQVQEGVVAAAGAIGVASSVFDDFATQLIISTKDLEDDEIAAAVQEALSGMADEMADLVLAGHDVIMAGETSSEALSRLSEHLTATAAVFDTLGHSMFEVSIAGADLASSLVQLFGGTDAFNTAASTYFTAFYSEAERVAVYTRQATEALAEFGIALPASRAAYRDLVESLDLTTSSGQELYAVLLQMSGTMDQILPAAQSFTEVISSLVGTTTGIVGEMISDVTSTARAAEQAATAWYRVADSLRDLILDITGASNSSFGGAARLQALQSALETAYQGALGGDRGAAEDFTAISGDYLAAARAQAGTLMEYRRAEAAVLSQANMLAGVSELQGSAEDAIVTLSQQQLDVLNELNTYLQSTETLDEEDLQCFEDTLTALQTAIEDLQDFSYADLMAQLQANIELIPTADVPEDVARLLYAATSGIQSEIQFAVVTQGLTPDLRWLAVNAASEHMKTIDFVLGEELPDDIMRLALDDVTTLTRTVSLVATSDLSADEMRVALAGSSELSRVVNVALASDADRAAIKLALGNLGAYAVTIQAALQAVPEVRSIIMEDAGLFALTVEAAFVQDLDPEIRRVLLDQQGGYVVNVLGILSEATSPEIAQLLLDANTEALRGITVGLAFADSVSDAERELLLSDSITVLHAITALVNPLGITTFDVMFLDQLQRGDGAVARSVNGYLDTRMIGGLGRTFIAELASGDGSVWRSVVANILMSGVTSLGYTYLNQLAQGAGSTWRAIQGGLQFGSVSDYGWRYLNQLFQGTGSIARIIRAAVDGTYVGHWASSYLNQIFAGNGFTNRYIRAATSEAFLSDWGALYLEQLFAGNGYTNRYIRASADLTRINGEAAAYLDQLTEGGGYTTRGIWGRVNISDVRGYSARYLEQLAAGYGYTTRGLWGRVNISDVQGYSARYLEQLAAGNGYANRYLRASVDARYVGAWAFGYLNQLYQGNGSITRTVRAGQNFSALNGFGEAYLGQLFAGGGYVTRTVRAGQNFSSLNGFGEAYLRQLFAGTGSVYRGISAAVNAGGISGTGATFLQNITAGAARIARTVNGAVDLSRVSGRGLTLLDMIQNTTTGTVTIGGGVVFDPSRDFSVWFERSMQTSITTPIATLRSALGELRAAILADMASRERDATLAALQQQLSDKVAQQSSVAARASSIMGQIRALEAATGVDLRNGNQDATLKVIDDKWISYLATHVDYGANSDLATFRQAFWGTGGLQDQLNALIGQPTAIYTAAANLREQIRAMGAVPAYAAGGFHAGGLRIVGENGPELEAVGAARYYSAPQTRNLLNGDSQLQHELLAELRAFRDEQRQLGLGSNRNTTKLRKLAEKADQLGTPVRNPDDGTALQVESI
ncbi:hypothetical protein ACX9MO_05185 [Pseudooceanicola sp. 502str34]